jgi:bacterioferritin (cytochrome b1)
MLTPAVAVTDLTETPGNDTMEGDSLQEVVQRWQRVRAQLQHRMPSSYRANRQQVILPLLSEALALALLCVCRYRKRSIADAFLTAHYLRYAHEAQCVAEEIAAYIHSLRAQPSFRPIQLREQLLVGGAEDEALPDLVAEDLIAGRIAVRSCREAVACLETRDRRTRELFEALLALHERHASGLARLHQQLRSAGVQNRPGSGALL